MIRIIIEKRSWNPIVNKIVHSDWLFSPTQPKQTSVSFCNADKKLTSYPPTLVMDKIEGRVDGGCMARVNIYA